MGRILTVIFCVAVSLPSPARAQEQSPHGGEGNLTRPGDPPPVRWKHYPGDWYGWGDCCCGCSGCDYAFDGHYGYPGYRPYRYPYYGCPRCGYPSEEEMDAECERRLQRRHPPRQGAASNSTAPEISP